MLPRRPPARDTVVGHRIERQSLKSQLAEIGYKPTDITYLAMSHSHGDHSGNANDYATATWIVQKAEREYDVFHDAGDDHERGARAGATSRGKQASARALSAHLASANDWTSAVAVAGTEP